MATLPCATCCAGWVQIFKSLIYKTLASQPIDVSIRWWKSKPGFCPVRPLVTRNEFDQAPQFLSLQLASSSHALEGPMPQSLAITRPYLSSTGKSWIFFATTSTPSKSGHKALLHRAVVKHGNPTAQHV